MATDPDEDLCTVQMMLMEAASMYGVNSPEYLAIEKVESRIIREMNKDYFQVGNTTDS